MKKEILICSIFRNRSKFVDRWYSQLCHIAKYYKDEYIFTLSIYENDSVDGTKEKLMSIHNNLYKNIYLKTENVNTNYYPSIMHEDRVKNLANARNTCLSLVKSNILNFEKVIFVEPDFKYDIDSAIKIISAEKIHNKKFDIISGIALEGERFYDTWATRKTKDDKQGVLSKGNSLEPMWSTFSGFCSYNPNGFADGAKFDWYNERFKSFDCDTSVICENFISLGYNQIYVDTSAVFYHE